MDFRLPKKYLGVTKRRSDAFAVFCRQPRTSLRWDSLAKTSCLFATKLFERWCKEENADVSGDLFFFLSPQIHCGMELESGRSAFLLGVCLCMFHVGFEISLERVDILYYGLYLWCCFFSYLKPDIGLSWGKATFIYLSYFLSEPSHCISSNIHPGKLTAGI